jgi:predicted DsbA family dithiol-disulfide isomerase
MRSLQLNKRDEIMLTIDYVSDVLCVWAWVSEERNKELQLQFHEQLSLQPKFINLFGNTEARIGKGWQEKGGFDGFAKHTQEVVAKFPELTLNDKVWSDVRPTSSMPAHLYLKAAELSGSDTETILKLARSLRHAFFADGLDISKFEVIEMVFATIGVSVDTINEQLKNGSAYAALWNDQLFREEQHIKGSPSYVIDGGRQILFGNVSYRVIEANINELVSPSPKEGASWC